MWGSRDTPQIGGGWSPVWGGGEGALASSPRLRTCRPVTRPERGVGEEVHFCITDITELQLIFGPSSLNFTTVDCLKHYRSEHFLTRSVTFKFKIIII